MIWGGAVPTVPGYEVISRLGSGGMSSVWKARNFVDGSLVAIKVLDRYQAQNIDNVQAFRDEEQIMENIQHPGIVRAYSYNRNADQPYLVMEYINGYSFASLLQRKKKLAQADCLLICLSVAAALNYAWNEHGVIHCDIKPENLMINTDGIVKLTDLGIARKFHNKDDNAKLEVPEHIVGTPAYISPEQVYGDVVLDCRTDIYSLGATLYHLSTGRTLFPSLNSEGEIRAQCDERQQAPDPRLYNEKLTEGFAQLLEAMLVKNRDDRLADWKSVYETASKVEAGETFKPRNSTSASSIKLLR